MKIVYCVCNLNKGVTMKVSFGGTEVDIGISDALFDVLLVAAETHVYAASIGIRPDAPNRKENLRYVPAPITIDL